MGNQTEIEYLSKMIFDKYGKVALDTKECAEVTGQAVVTLKSHRALNVGIPYLKDIRAVKYNVIDIAKWMLENRVRVA